MIRIFLDANVLFTAAHNPDGKAAFLIQLAAAGPFKLFTSAYSREESERNMSAKYPGSLIVFKQLSENITLVPLYCPPAFTLKSFLPKMLFKAVRAASSFPDVVCSLANCYCHKARFS